MVKKSLKRLEAATHNPSNTASWEKQELGVYAAMVHIWADIKAWLWRSIEM